MVRSVLGLRPGCEEGVGGFQDRFARDRGFEWRKRNDSVRRNGCKVDLTDCKLWCQDNSIHHNRTL